MDAMLRAGNALWRAQAHTQAEGGSRLKPAGFGRSTYLVFRNPLESLEEALLHTRSVVCWRLGEHGSPDFRMQRSGSAYPIATRGMTGPAYGRS